MTFIQTINPGDATGELAEWYTKAGNPDGTVDEVMQVHSLNPETLRTHFQMYVAAMHKQSPLSRIEREIVAVLISQLNGCDYCVQHHAAGLKRLLPADRHAVAQQLREGRTAELTPREQAMASYASKLTQTPDQVTEEDVNQLRTHGLDDRAILDLTQVIGYFNYVNRIVLGLGVNVDDEPAPPGQRPISE